MVFAAILGGLLPSFMLVGLGGLVRKRLSENAWTGLDRLNFEVLFPALLFTAAAARPIDIGRLFTLAPAALAIAVLGLSAGFSIRRWGPVRFLDFAGAWQTAWRFNTAMAFVAVASVTRADAALMAVVVGVAVPVSNLFAVSALSRGGDLGILQTMKRVAMNPYLQASVLGVTVGISGLKVPHLVLAPLDLLAQAAIPIALISIGATMDWKALARLNRFTGALAGIKLLLLPAVTLLVSLLFGADPAIAAVLVTFAALPTASAAHVLAGAFGADRVLVATIVAQSTLISAVTLPLWIYAVESLF